MQSKESSKSSVTHKLKGAITAMRNDKTFLVTTVVIILIAAYLLHLVLPFGGPRQSAPPSHPQQSVLPQNRLISKPKNLTSEYLLNKTSGQSRPSVVDDPINVSVVINQSTLQVNRPFRVDIVFNGTFNFLNQNTSGYMQNIVGTEYVGFYSANATDMLVYNNRPNVSTYFTLGSPAYEFTPSGANPYNTSAILFNLTPTAATVGKTWYFCGGEFMTFKNNTGYSGIFDNLTYARIAVRNSTVINLMSPQCVARAI